MENFPQTNSILNLLKSRAIIPLLILLSFSFFTTSCEKEPKLDAPQIASIGISADTTITLGSSLKLTPTQVAQLGTTFQWKVNNNVVSTEPNFVFEPKEEGVYSLSYQATNEAGTAIKEVTITVKKYYKGILIVNEGWFGHENGSVNYFNLNTNTQHLDIFKTNNPGLELGTTTQYGTVQGGNLYIISKMGRSIVVADASTMKEKGSLTLESSISGRAFTAVSNQFGVLTTSKGAYKLNLNPLSLGQVLPGLEEVSNKQCGGVYANDKFIFVISQTKGALIYDATTLKLEKTIEGIEVGFARTKDGAVWASKKQSTLVKIDPITLATTEYPLPSTIKIHNSWGAWNAGSLCASYKENALYFTKAGAWGGGNQIYKYIPGQESSLDKVFATGKADDAFYGASIAVDPATDNVVATYVKDGWGDSFSDNRLVIFNGKTGAEVKRITFEHFWFPSMILFN